jgi:hypothetical protein
MRLLIPLQAAQIGIVGIGVLRAAQLDFGTLIPN